GEGASAEGPLRDAVAVGRKPTVLKLTGTLCVARHLGDLAGRDGFLPHLAEPGEHRRDRVGLVLDEVPQPRGRPGAGEACPDAVVDDLLGVVGLESRGDVGPAQVEPGGLLRADRQLDLRLGPRELRGEVVDRDALASDLLEPWWR